MNSLKYSSMLHVFNSFTFNEQEMIISNLIKEANIITLDNINDDNYLDDNCKEIARFLFRITKIDKTTKTDVEKSIKLLDYLFNLVTEGNITHRTYCKENYKIANKRSNTICCDNYTISRGREKNYFKFFDEVSKQTFYNKLLTDAKHFNIIINNKRVSFKDLLNNCSELEQSEWNNNYPINNVIYKVNDLILQNSYLHIFICHYLNDYYIKNNYIHNDIKNNRYNVTMDNIIEENEILKSITHNQLGFDFSECSTNEIIELTVNRDED